MGKKTTPDKLALMQRLYAEDVKLEEIARITGVSQSTVSRHVSGGERKRGNRPTYGLSEATDIAARIRRGEGLTRIADEYGVWTDTIQKLLKREGLYDREAIYMARSLTKSIMTPNQERKVADLSINGMSTYQIAKQMGIPKSTIHCILVRQGVKAKSPSKREIIE